MASGKRMSKYIGYKVGQEIREYKKKNNLTNKDLAEMFDCSPGTVAKWCGMNWDMRLDSFLTVVKTLELDIHLLVKGTQWEGV